MNLTQSKSNAATPGIPTSTRKARLPAWLFSWEIYLIVLIAGFLRLYQLNTTEFDTDQAIIFGMAHDAIRFGLIPATSNASSIDIAHPPGVIYLFMLPALVSANPLGGAILVGIFATAGVVLTYYFTRRYYGRLPGAVTALLYASATTPMRYARFIWQPNLMPPFVVLFMFALFWGVVERRKGWLFPALLLLGILYQMHEITLLLGVPLLVAVLLAPKTMRWRDLVLALVSLLIVFFPFFLWEALTQFVDLHTFFTLSKQHAHIDNQAILFYRLFLIPYDQPPTHPHSVLRMLNPVLFWLRYIMPLLAICGIVAALVMVLRSSRDGEAQFIAPKKRDVMTKRAINLLSIKEWWTNFRANPYRCGLVLLLIWQIVPVLILSRHAIDLHTQYFFLLMPGPFILIGLFITKVVEWLQHHPQWSGMRYGIYALVGLIVATQLVGSTAQIIDASRGNFDDRIPNPSFYFNDISSEQHALSEADQLAQQRHLNRVYITTNENTQISLSYLAEQMQTPTTLFDATHCLVLPNPAGGPAVLLVGPYNNQTNALLSQFATATLVDQPARLGGAPFRLYIVTPLAGQLSSSSMFKNDLQLLDAQTQRLSSGTMLSLVTRWTLLRSARRSPHTTYNYSIRASLSRSNDHLPESLCTFTSMQQGDRLLVIFTLPKNTQVPVSVTLAAQSFTTTPNNPAYGPLHLETNSTQTTAWETLQTPEESNSITVRTS